MGDHLGKTKLSGYAILVQESLVDLAADAIRKYVFDRRLAPGDRLPSERDLAVGLAVSRPAVREAVRRLVAERVVEVRGRSGIFIAESDVDAIFQVRMELEPLAAALAAARRTDRDVSLLESLIEQLRVRQGEPAEFSAVDGHLHVAIAEASGNSILHSFVAQLNDLTLLSRVTTARDDETRAHTVGNWTRLVAAVKSNDDAAAGRCMRDHLYAVLRTASAPAAPVALQPIARAAR